MNRQSNPKKKITLVPHGGLGNRLRAIASILHFAQKMDYEVSTLWFCNKDLNARFDQLFEPLPEANIKYRSPIHFFTFWHPRKRNLYLPLLIRPLFFDKIIDSHTSAIIQNDPQALLQEISKSKNSYIFTCFQHGQTERYSTIFKPLPFILDAVNKYKSEHFSEYTIGMHIRRTDHATCIKNSPSTLFRERIKEEIENNPKVKIYIASDDPKEKIQLIDLFGDSIITQNRSADRNSLQGIVFAVEELLILSQCKKIYASYGSSYSEIAQMFNPTTPLIVLQQ